MDPSRGDSRYNLNYSMSSIGLSLADQADMYGSNPAAVAALGGRPPSGGLIQPMSSSSGVGFSARSSNILPNNTAQCQSLGNSTNSAGSSGQQRGIKRAGSECYDDHHRSSSGGLTQSLQGLDSCVGGNGQQNSQPQAQVGGVTDVDDSYNALQNKKSPPANGKKTKGRVKIKMEYIDNKLRRYTTFSKRKTGIMKKAYELSTLTGTQVMLLVASETGHVYTFATRKLQPMITSEAGKQLIQTCLNSPDPPNVGGGDQRMSATGFEETELSYNIADEDSKDDRTPLSSPNESDDSSDVDSTGPSMDVSKNLSETPSNPKSTLENTFADRQRYKPPISQSESKQASNNSVIVLCPNADEKPICTSSTDNQVFSSSNISNVPHEVILQLIQSGHLQVHTEEDGSGEQYVAIPLPSSAANLLKLNKTDASKYLQSSEKEDKNKHATSEMIIKQEFE